MKLYTVDYLMIEQTTLDRKLVLTHRWFENNLGLLLQTLKGAEQKLKRLDKMEIEWVLVKVRGLYMYIFWLSKCLMVVY